VENPENANNESFDQKFCSVLEYHLTKAFKNSDDENVKGFWCDGVMVPSNSQLFKKNINDSRKIVTTAFIGKDGQQEFLMTVKFGPRSLSKYARDLPLNDCLPELTASGWWILDSKKRAIELQLK
jgi:hypothetical protein